MRHGRVVTSLRTSDPVISIDFWVGAANNSCIEAPAVEYIEGCQFFQEAAYVYHSSEILLRRVPLRFALHAAHCSDREPRLLGASRGVAFLRQGCTERVHQWQRCCCWTVRLGCGVRLCEITRRPDTNCQANPV